MVIPIFCIDQRRFGPESRWLGSRKNMKSADTMSALRQSNQGILEMRVSLVLKSEQRDAVTHDQSILILIS
jgi:hypothetical protein